MSQIKVDVLVSGAGPVGLFFAYQMAKRGHSVFCVDPKLGPTDQSRALLISARTLEILEARGLVAEILSKAYVTSGMRMHRNGVYKAQIEADADTPFSHITVLMQGITERILVDRLNEDTGCRVNWNTELVSYTQNKDSVTSIVRNVQTKEEQQIESTYIIGADGSHSRVRKSNPDWTYEGVSVQTKCFVADLTLKGDNIEKMTDKSNVFMKGSHALGVIRLLPLKETDDDSHHFRIFGNLEAYQCSEQNQNDPTHGLIDKNQEEPPTLEFLQSWVDEITCPLKLEASDIVWSSYFKINERIANGFRKNRAFLIGGLSCSL
ncbi:FAD-binding monooxygenase [Mucor mucedo]|uniref:FAD-binding monooxygenase n=1 Tax=Mucor mucedo TaxID=29922 RepID=UPI00221F55CF|nr:FAD-binding monooxygenase [Mucor mucedo]KAI7890806.1 FAD-binding monooxygenase [Mucor mucedo]